MSIVCVVKEVSGPRSRKQGVGRIYGETAVDYWEGRGWE